MPNYFENLPNEIIDYIYLIRYKDDFKKTLNQINYKNLLLNADKDALNKFYNGENCWWKKFHHLNPDKDKIYITIALEKRKGWLAEAVKEKLNITMFKRYKKNLDEIKHFENKYKNKYNLIYSSKLTILNYNDDVFYSNLLHKRHHIYTKDDLKLMLRNNGYLNSSIQIEDQLSGEALKQYYAREKPNIFNYKYFYNSWTREKLIKELMQL